MVFYFYGVNNIRHQKAERRRLPNKSILRRRAVGSNEIPGFQDAYSQIEFAVASATTPSLVFESDANVSYDRRFLQVV